LRGAGNRKKCHDENDAAHHKYTFDETEDRASETIDRFHKRNYRNESEYFFEDIKEETNEARHDHKQNRKREYAHEVWVAAENGHGPTGNRNIKTRRDNGADNNANKAAERMNEPEPKTIQDEAAQNDE